MDNFLVDWLNNSKYWFSKTKEVDEYIILKYQNLLDIKENNSNILASIILYDQIPRHIFRNTLCNHIIDYFNLLSIKLINKNIDILNSLNNEELCFCLLPLRHTKDIDLIKYCIKLILDKSYHHSYKKFLKASYEQLLFLDTTKWIKDVSNYKIIKPDYSILDYYPRFYIRNDNEYIGNYNILNPDLPIIISLSGGVDSMVCSYSIRNKFPNKKLIAVHVNYSNRDTCDEEVKFLIEWCSFLDIKLYVRTLDEINRKYCMENELREIYEKYTRIMRFNLYKKFGINAQIIMGHNKCDCFENIMTNLAHKNKYDNLYGMDFYIKLDNINFYRPLLDINKNVIIEFAQNNNIPYLPTSTPKWSQRGQIRNNVEPVLNNWNKDFIPGLYELRNIVKDLYFELYRNIDNFIDKINNKSLFNINNDISLSKIFWKEILQKYNINISNKSLNNLIINLKIYIKNFKKFQINTKRSISLNLISSLEFYKFNENNFKIILLKK